MKQGLGVTALVLAACGQPSGPGEFQAREERAVRPAALVAEEVFPDLPGLASHPWMRYYGQIPEGYFEVVADRYPNLLLEYPELARMNRRYLAFLADRRPSGPAPTSQIDLFRRAFTFDVPAGWEQLPPPTDSMTVTALRPGGDPDASCTFTMLPGDGGGAAMNINRWRDQMGLEPIGASEVSELPTQTWLQLPGSPGITSQVVDIEGTFTAMGGAPRENWRLLGLVAVTPVGAFFLKMTGPAGLVEAERERFFAFCDSVTFVEELIGADGPDGGAAPGPTGDGPAVSPHTVTWTAPEGWAVQDAKFMRHVSYEVAPGVEAWISFARGGVLPNYNRWCGEVGARSMTMAEVEALPKVTILGEECPLLSVDGPYRSVPDATLVATMCSLAGGEDMFVKMVGPREAVAAAMDDFHTFCGSIGGN